MSKPFLMASLILVGSLSWLGYAADDKEKQEGETHKTRKELAAEELAIATRAVEVGLEGFRSMRIRLSDAQVERWSLRRIAAIEAGGGKDEDLHKARVAHRDLMKTLEKLAKSLFNSAQAAELDYLEARYARVEADRQLREEGDDEDEEESSDKAEADDEKAPKERTRG